MQDYYCLLTIINIINKTILQFLEILCSIIEKGTTIHNITIMHNILAANFSFISLNHIVIHAFFYSCLCVLCVAVIFVLRRDNKCEFLVSSWVCYVVHHCLKMLKSPHMAFLRDGWKAWLRSYSSFLLLSYIYNNNDNNYYYY